MLRSRIRNQEYRQLRTELTQIGLSQDREALSRLRKSKLQQIVNLGKKAEDAKEIVDIFMDGVEDLVLNTLKNQSDPETLLQIKMYYKACLMLEKEISNMITEARIKQKTIEEINKGKGEK